MRPSCASAWSGCETSSAASGEISARGLLTSVEIDLPGREPPADAVRRICHECYERGVILRSAAEGQRAAVYFYPPLVVSADEIREAFAAIADALRVVVAAA